jgi:hypothetical protein
MTAAEVIREQKKLARQMRHDSLFRYWQDVERLVFNENIPFDVATRIEAIKRGYTDPARLRIRPAPGR